MNRDCSKAYVRQPYSKGWTAALFHLILSARSPMLAMHRWGLILAVLIVPLSSVDAQDKRSFSMADSVLLFGTYTELRVVTPDRVLSLKPPVDLGYNHGYFIYPGLAPRGDLVAWGFALDSQKDRSPNSGRFALGVYSIQEQKWKTYGDFDDIGTPAFSPDGSKIAFVTIEGREEHLQLFDVATEKMTVTNVNAGGSPERGGIPAKAGIGWSPDGKRLVVEFARAERPSLIAVIDPSTGDQKPIGEGSHPSWSPTGEWIAYYGDFNKKCMLVHPDGTGTKIVSKIKSFFAYRRYGYAVVWSPDGRQLLLNAWRGEYGAIETKLLDLKTGRSQTRTTNGLAAFGWVSQRK
jgi:WD40-like Beta Propeller Repeat